MFLSWKGARTHLSPQFIYPKIESAEILERMLVQKKGKVVTEVLVRWKGETVEDATWELWNELQTKFPTFVEGNHPWGQGSSEPGG